MKKVFLEVNEFKTRMMQMQTMPYSLAPNPIFTGFSLIITVSSRTPQVGWFFVDYSCVFSNTPGRVVFRRLFLWLAFVAAITNCTVVLLLLLLLLWIGCCLFCPAAVLNHRRRRVVAVRQESPKLLRRIRWCLLLLLFLIIVSPPPVPKSEVDTTGLSALWYVR